MGNESFSSSFITVIDRTDTMWTRLTASVYLIDREGKGEKA